MSIVTNPDPIIARISAALRALDGTKPVIGLGGAHAKGQADEHSDIDFYVFASGLPAAQRLSEDLASRLPEATAFKTWSGEFEAGVDFDFAGQVVEWGPPNLVIANPQHPYTKLLLSAVPDPSIKLGARGARSFAEKAEAVRASAKKKVAEVKQVQAGHYVRHFEAVP